jgi:hypothetical protein
MLLQMTNELPLKLYKYRDWTNNFHKKCLTEPEVYFASSKEFNDPFDCSMPFKYKESDLSEENIFLKTIDVLKRKHSDWSIDKIHQEAFENQREGLIFDKNYIQFRSEERIKNFNKTFGILSLTKESNNVLMWSHYASSHTGFCIGYDTKMLWSQTQGRIGPVMYDDKFPEYGLFDKGLEKNMKYSSIKSSNWSYENEFRIIIAYKTGKIVTLKEDVITEIIFGCKMDFKHRMEIIDIVKKKYPKASVYDSVPDKNMFQLNLNRVY